jgi:4-coumarate--CoA ligase
MDLPADARLDRPPAAMDSLEALELAGAVNEMFQLHRTGLEDNLLRFRSLDRWTEVVVRSWAAHPEAVVFRTSGTTGEPRAIRHSAESLAREIGFHAARFADRRRVVAFPPAHHIYGFLFTVMLPQALSLPLAEGWRMGSGALAADLRPGDLVIGFPAIWRYLAASMPDWPADVRGVTSTGPMDSDVAEDLRRAGLAGLTEIYGSSETAGIGARDSHEAPFELLDFWRRDGMEGLVRVGSDGVAGESVPVPDRLIWESERTFRPAGRLDGAVVVGGVNVHPDRVAAALREHPAVRECAVRPFRAEGETRLKAFVVPAVSVASDRLRAQLEAWSAARFSAPERPVRLDFGDRLPRNAMGKAADW